jgi:hypothetical protein
MDLLWPSPKGKWHMPRQGMDVCPNTGRSPRIEPGASSVEILLKYYGVPSHSIQSKIMLIHWMVSAK